MLYCSQNEKAGLPLPERVSIMPNIMLTYRCNLRCPYCFANEFVNRADTDITEADFRTAVKFAAGTPHASIGLIGGEPTTHPKLPEFLRLLADEPNVDTVMVYTNGLAMEPLLKAMKEPSVGSKVRVLVNCNSPAVMGEHNFSRLRESLDRAFLDYRLGRHIKFGLNLYENGFDYGFIKELLVRYDRRQLRISLTVPDFGVCGRVDPVENFKSRKDYLLRFFRDMDEIGVLPYYDCNKPPQCIWTDEEWAWLERFAARHRGIPTNLVDQTSRCRPVVDILPDLRAVRCFGMSDFEKVHIRDFACMEDLESYFRNRVDAEAFRICASPDCRDCYDRKCGLCAAGCLGYKQAQLRKINDLVSAMT